MTPKIVPFHSPREMTSVQLAKKLNLLSDLLLTRKRIQHHIRVTEKEIARLKAELKENNPGEKENTHS